MVSTTDNSVFDFDLDFLEQPNSVVTECNADKKRKSVYIVKKKLIASDLLLQKYYAKNEQLQQNEVHLLAAKEECKQVCIDYNNTLEKCTQLQKDIEILTTRYKELENNYILSSNQCEAMKSHAHQLEVLVKNREIEISTLKGENKSRTKDSEKIQETEKKLIAILEENKTLLRHICLVRDVALGKRKIRKRHKLLLQKYDSVKRVSDSEESSEDSSEENYLFDSSPPSPMSEHGIKDTNLEETHQFHPKEKVVITVIEDHESDCSNEVVSEDTGRGSSLACSEKFGNSPDYFLNDSPLSTDLNKIKENKFLRDIGTSPLRQQELPDMTRSPLRKVELVDTAISPILFDGEFYVQTIIEIENEEQSIISDISPSDNVVNKKTIHLGTNTVKNVEQVEVSSSPLVIVESNLDSDLNITDNPQCNIEDDQENRVIEGASFIGNKIPLTKMLSNKETKHINVDKLSSHCELEISETTTTFEQQECLERNNSKTLCNEISDNNEIIKILNSMRFNEKMITPLPKTPVKLSKKEHRTQQQAAVMEPSHFEHSQYVTYSDLVKLMDAYIKPINEKIDALSNNIANVRHIPIPSNPQIFLDETSQVSNVDYIDNDSSGNVIYDEVSENQLFDRLMNVEEAPVPELNFRKKVDVQNTEEIKHIHKELLCSENTHALSTDSHELSTDIPVVESNVRKEIENETCLQETLTVEPETKNNSCEDVPVSELPIVITYEDEEETNHLINKEWLLGLELDDDQNNQQVDEGQNKSVSSDNSKTKCAKKKKLSRLDKLKKTLLPKSKIAVIKEPVMRTRCKPKIKPIKKQEPLMDTMALLNKKSAYEKAVEVMREIRLQEKLNSTEKRILKKPKIKYNNKLDKVDFKGSNDSKDSQANKDVSCKNSKPKQDTHCVDSNIKQDAVELLFIKEPIVCISPINIENMLSGNNNIGQEEFSPTSNKRSTRSQRKLSENSNSSCRKTTVSSSNSNIEIFKEYEATPSKRLKRDTSEESVTKFKRVLRSATLNERRLSINKNVEVSNESPKSTRKLPRRNRNSVSENIQNRNVQSSCQNNQNDNTISNLDKVRKQLTYDKVSLKESKQNKNYNSLGQCNQNDELNDTHLHEDVAPLNNYKGFYNKSPELPRKQPTRNRNSVSELGKNKNDSLDQCNQNGMLIDTNLDKNVTPIKNSKNFYNETPELVRKPLTRNRNSVSVSEQIITYSQQNNSRSKENEKLEEAEFVKDVNLLNHAEESISNKSPKVPHKRLARNRNSVNETKQNNNNNNLCQYIQNNELNDSHFVENDTRLDHTTRDISTKITEVLPKPLTRSRLSVNENKKNNNSFCQYNQYDELDDSHFDENVTILNRPTEIISYNSPELPRKLPIRNRNLASENKQNRYCKTSQYDDLNEYASPQNHPKDSILCRMIDKYGRNKIKFSAKKVPDNTLNSICKKLEDSISHIIELPIDKAKTAMCKLVEDIQYNWNLRNFLAGLIRYLKDPQRKTELFTKVTSPPAPPMTKSEQVLLFIVKHLQNTMPNIVNAVLAHIEFTLFQLNKTPEFDVIESMSHFYALVCRYFGLKMRLRLFMLDAMYCLSFKVVPLIRQCLDVWMHILPLAHMGIAKSPLVTCLVYLLHFYKCEDRFKRVHDIRNILSKKYFYNITDWNENKILEMFKISIKELRDIPVEKKMLRMALIILAKRQGAKWCQKNLVKKLLMPVLEEDVPLRSKQFCAAMLGPLLKPYPMDMKVHCEIVVNNLLDMLDQDPPDSLKEAIFTSLIYMNKHNQDRVTQALLAWWPQQVSQEFEQLIQDFVREKPLRVWKGILSRVSP